MTLVTTKYRPLLDVPGHPGLRCIEPTIAPFLAWEADVKAAGGVLHVNSMTRTCAEQQPLFDKYKRWVEAGKPEKYDSNVMTNVVACEPGRSGHQGGISVDVNTFKCFPAAPADQQVDLLWKTGKPHGWRPIIDQPDEARSERWHYDQHQTWLSVHDKLGADAAYYCSALDVGQAGKWQSDEALLQALVLRAGINIGKPDGQIGPKTSAALVQLGIIVDLRHLEPAIVSLRALPAKDLA